MADPYREGVPILQNDDKGFNLSFTRLNYHVKGGCKSQPKHILHNLAGVARAGELVAIMGPSGSGKTTLLNILANRVSTGKITGQVAINRQNAKKVFQRHGAYVTQDDILYGDLTVRETLMYAALLRLPFSMSHKEKSKAVDELIEMLGLTAVKNSRIGGLYIRGISGGEKRRVSIGVEVVTSPGLLLADEVTSGLDSHAAAKVMDILLNMTKRGTTVLTTIHQPSSQIYQRFDQLLLLGKGNTMYFGAAEHAVHYFANLGFQSPPGWNPADYLLDLVADETKHPQLIEDFQRSDPNQRLKSLVQEYHPRDSKRDSTEISAPSSFWCCSNKTPWLYQFFVLSHRNIVRMIKNPFNSLQMLVSYLFSAVFMGALFADLKQNADNQLTLCLAFMLDVFGINAFFAVGLFMQDAAVYRREHRGGYYSASAFYLSRIICLIPLNALVCFGYTAIMFYWLNLGNQEPNKLGLMFLINYLTLETFLGMNEIFGVVCTRFDTGIVTAGVFNTVQMLLNGAFVNYPNIPQYLQWSYWVAFMMYSMTGVMLLQYNDTPAGQEYLKLYGIQVWEVDTCIYVLLAWCVFFRLLCYICIRIFCRK